MTTTYSLEEVGMSFNGMKIFFTHTALAETDVHLFPPSKNRSKRIRKKLIKRFGGEFKKEAAMWRIGNRIFAHPSFREKLLAVG